MKFKALLSITALWGLCFMAMAESDEVASSETTAEASKEVTVAVSPRQVISIGEFKNKTSAPKEMFDTLLDRITDSIVNTRKFEVVDNARIKEALNEQKKVDLGLSEEGVGTPKQVKIKSANWVLYGTVTQLGLADKKHAGDGYSSNKPRFCDWAARI